MSEKRIEITNTLCRQVQLLIKGGATNKEAGELVGVSAATVSRIRTANYDPFKYQQNTEARRKLEENIQKHLPNFISREAVENVRPEYVEDKNHPGTYHLQLTKGDDNDQVPGQMAMELPQEEPEKDMNDQAKMMRFLAGKFSDNAGDIRALAQWVVKINSTLDKINDNLCQILRRMDNVK